MRYTSLIVWIFALTATGSQAFAEITWWQQIHELSHSDKQERFALLKSLKKYKSVYGQVKEAIHGGPHQGEAIEAALWLHLQTLWPDLKQEAEAHPSWELILALETLNDEQVHPDWKPWLKEAVEPRRWDHLSSTTRLAVINMLVAEKLTLSSEQFSRLLHDKSTVVRMATVHLVAADLKLQPLNKSLHASMDSALTADEAQMRVEALFAIQRQTASVRSDFKDTLGHCATSEKIEGVKSKCQQLLKSL